MQDRIDSPGMGQGRKTARSPAGALHSYQAQASCPQGHQAGRSLFCLPVTVSEKHKEADKVMYRGSWSYRVPARLVVSKWMLRVFFRSRHERNFFYGVQEELGELWVVEREANFERRWPSEVRV